MIVSSYNNCKFVQISLLYGYYFLLYSWLQKWFRMSAHSNLLEQRLCWSLPVWKMWHKCAVFCKKSPCSMQLPSWLQTWSWSLHSMQTVWVSNRSWLCYFSCMCQWKMCKSLPMCKVCWMQCQKPQRNLHLFAWLWWKSIWRSMFSK